MSFFLFNVLVKNWTYRCVCRLIKKLCYNFLQHDTSSPTSCFLLLYSCCVNLYFCPLDSSCMSFFLLYFFVSFWTFCYKTFPISSLSPFFSKINCFDFPLTSLFHSIFIFHTQAFLLDALPWSFLSTFSCVFGQAFPLVYFFFAHLLWTSLVGSEGLPLVF